jgi:hypothetical protein
MNRSANFIIVESHRFLPALLIRDVGPWTHYLTVTNAAEIVVAELVTQGALKPNGQRLLYVDSAGELDEILVSDGRFAGFRHLSAAERLHP